MNFKFKKTFSVILSMIIAFSTNLIAIAENEKSWKNKIDEKIYEEATGKDDVIPVYIWLTDVDHDEVIAKTEKTLGYGEKDLAVVDEYISDELAVAINNLSEKENSSVKDELQKYMKKTEKKRKAEKEKTDKYISEKRSNYRDKYNEKSKDFLEKAKISDENIIFKSQYAPMIIAELTLKQVEKLSKYNDISEISIYKNNVKYVQTATSTMEQVKSSTNIDLIHDIGITGLGVKIGVYDFGVFSSAESELNADRIYENIPPAYTPSYSNSDNTNHINNIIKYGFGENGIANDVEVYIVGSDCFAYEDIEALLSLGVQIINHSGCSEWDLLYDDAVKWVDHITKQHNVSFVQAAGNIGGNIGKPGLAYNVITVGGYDNNSTYASQDDTIFPGSCYINTGFCEKPDIVANAYAFGEYGTSYSAPFVSGLISLMLEIRPSLAAYPQAIKAILLASCHHKSISSPTETMSQGITDIQGAGVVDAYRAISITGRGNYGVRELSGGVVSTDVKFNVPFLYEATGINVSIAWLKNNYITSSNHTMYPATNGKPHNLNLEILACDTSVGTSAKGNSSTEMVYISTPVANTTYTARINKVNSDVDTVKVGYAWSFDEEQFQYTGDNEGIYFIKNKQSGNYLNYSSSAGVTQKTFGDSLYQRWVVYKRANGNYTISSFIGANGCLDVNSLISGKYYSISLDSSNAADITIGENLDGSVYILKYEDGQQYLLGILNNSTANNAPAVWKKKDTAADMELSQLWYLEPICYQVGDVDMNGSITAADSRIVLNYSAGTGELGSTSIMNVLLYLADANSDGQITAADSRLILRFAAGLE